jgi:hypothetical protein
MMHLTRLPADAARPPWNLELAIGNNKKKEAAFQLIFSHRGALRTELVKCAMQLIDVQLRTSTVIEQAQLQILNRLG